MITFSRMSRIQIPEAARSVPLRVSMRLLRLYSGCAAPLRTSNYIPRCLLTQFSKLSQFRFVLPCLRSPGAAGLSNMPPVGGTAADGPGAQTGRKLLPNESPLLMLRRQRRSQSLQRRPLDAVWEVGYVMRGRERNTFTPRRVCAGIKSACALPTSCAGSCPDSLVQLGKEQ